MKDLVEYCLRPFNDDYIRQLVLRTTNRSAIDRIFQTLTQRQYSKLSSKNVNLFTTNRRLELLLRSEFQSRHIAYTAKGLVWALFKDKSLPMKHLNSQTYSRTNRSGTEQSLTTSEVEAVHIMTHESILYLSEMFVEAKSNSINQAFLLTNSLSFWPRVGAAAMHLSGGLVLSYEHGISDPTQQIRLNLPVVDHFLTRSEFVALQISQQLNEGKTAVCVGGLSPEMWNAKIHKRGIRREFRDRSVLFMGNTEDSRDIIFETFQICRQEGFNFAFRPHPKTSFGAARELGVPLEFSSRQGKHSLLQSARNWGIFIGEYSTSLLDAKYFGARSIQLIDREERRLSVPVDVSFACSLAELRHVLNAIKDDHQEPVVVPADEVRKKLFLALKDLGVATPDEGFSAV